MFATIRPISPKIASRWFASSVDYRRTSTGGAAHLDTFDFQAEAFYLKGGYEMFGILDDCPPGHKRFFLRKTLVTTPAKTLNPSSTSRLGAAA
jgi:hypothetical protein